MPRIVPTTSYGWVVPDLKDIAEDLYKIATGTTEQITQVEAQVCHHHLNKILKSLLLAAGLAACQGTPRMLSLINLASSVKTATESPSTLI